MAVPRVYKSITDHQKLCEFADSFMESYRLDLDEGLARLFREDAGDEGPVPELLPFVDALRTRLRRSLDELLVAEKEHLDELSGDATYRSIRDGSATSLRRTLIDLRGLFRSSFGLEMAQAVGFENEIAQDPLALARQTERLLANLRKPDLELPPSQYAGVAVTPGLIVDGVEPQYEELRRAIDQVTRELGRAQGTQVAKDQALVRFRQTYVQFLRILQGAFRLAGKPELAARLRRSLPGSGRSRLDGDVPGDGGPGEGEPPSGEPGEGEPSDGEPEPPPSSDGGGEADAAG